jgi:hypothetical protein
MRLFRKRKAMCDIEKEVDKETSSAEVVALKESHKTAEQTTRDIDKLNTLLKTNVITLKIHIVTGGGHGHK